MRHKTADFRLRVTLATAMPKLELGGAWNFSECSALIIVTTGFKPVAITALNICVIKNKTTKKQNSASAWICSPIVFHKYTLHCSCTNWTLFVMHLYCQASSLTGVPIKRASFPVKLCWVSTPYTLYYILSHPISVRLPFLVISTTMTVGNPG